MIWYRIAIACWLLPMITGISIFFTWTQVRRPELMAAGLIVIYLGITLFLVGMVCLWVWHAKVPEDVRNTPTHSLKSMVAGCLLLSNFPIALAIVVAAIDIETRYAVTVVNDSDSPITEFVLSAPGFSIEIATIPTHDRLSKSFQINGEGVMKCTYVHNGGRHEALVDGYVCGGLGGRKLVRILANGQAIVEDPSRSSN